MRRIAGPLQKKIAEEIISQLPKKVYLSFDIDGLDPSCAPGVSHREPGGLTTRQAINVIQHLKGKVIGADVVEYNPRADLDGMTSMVAAKLVKEIAARMIADAGDIEVISK